MILAIETSCDETSVAVIKDSKIISNIVATQIPYHQKYGGVMPELASRMHTQSITMVLDQALIQANCQLKDIEAIAVTVGPGLMGSLNVGLQAAKALAIALNKPLIGVNHILGHIYSNAIDKRISYPALSLVVSGGHTELILLSSQDDYEVLGTTLDDAVGEVYDKVARILNLGYPGGAIIDKLATIGEVKYVLPQPKNDQTLDFSFSGLKTSVLTLINNFNMKEEQFKNEDVAASFQDAVVNILIKKVKLAISKYPVKNLLLAGGVAANSKLRQEILNLESDNLKVLIPQIKYCGDNAGMIGIVGQMLYEKGEFANLNIGVNPNMKV